MANITSENFTTTSKQRDLNIDIVAGIMILHMVIGHYSSFDAQKYLTFFMPWFFFKSGMYYQKKPMEKCIKSCKKLLLPLIVFGIIGTIEHELALWMTGDFNIIHYTLTPLKEIALAGTVEGNNPLWFLTTLIFVKLIYNYLHITNRNRWIIIFATLLAAYLQNLYKMHFPEYFANGCSGLFFYAIGDMLRDKQYHKNYWIPAFAICIIIAITCMSVVTMRANRLEEGFYLVWIVYSICGCIALNAIFKQIPYRFPLLSWVGVNAMVIYTTHWFFLEICDVFIPKLMNIQYTGYERNIVLYSFFIIGELLLIQLFKQKRFSWIIGK